MQSMYCQARFDEVISFQLIRVKIFFVEESQKFNVLDYVWRKLVCTSSSTNLM